MHWGYLPAGGWGRTCAVQPIWHRTCQVCGTLSETWKRRAMTAAIRARVQRWSSTQPCAAGPLSSSAFSRTRICGVIRLDRPLGPLERRAFTPPASQSRRQA